MSGYRKKWSELSEEEKVQIRLRQKRADLYRLQGKPLLIRPEEADAARRHVQGIREECGMTFQAMEDQTGIAKSTFQRLLRYPEVRLFREKFEKIMALEPVEPPAPRLGHMHGARLDATATLRKMRGLCAVGYGGKWIAEETETTSYQQIHYLMIKGAKWVDFGFARLVDELYEKYAFVDPLTVGRSSFQVARAKTAARNNGWTPPICWDDDTIGDPEAIPEWTGRCGTIRGWQIHLDERIHVQEVIHKSQERGTRSKLVVLCEPCLAARKEAGPGNGPKFERWELAEMLEDGLAIAQIAQIFGVHERTLNRVIREERERGNL